LPQQRTCRCGQRSKVLGSLLKSLDPIEDLARFVDRECELRAAVFHNPACLKQQSYRKGVPFFCGVHGPHKPSRAQEVDTQLW
jgi:hypothetical protein